MAGRSQLLLTHVAASREVDAVSSQSRISTRRRGDQRPSNVNNDLQCNDAIPANPSTASLVEDGARTTTTTTRKKVGRGAFAAVLIPLSSFHMAMAIHAQRRVS